MTLREVLKIYNFRQFVNDKQNTQIVRINDNFENRWFEFGVEDWNYQSERDDFVELIFKKKFLDKEVISITYNEEAEVVEIYVQEKEDEA